MGVELIGGGGMNTNTPRDEKLPTVFICSFTYGGIESATMWTMVREMRKMDQFGINFLMNNVHGDALISRSRSKALHEFLKTDLDVCVMVDHDLEWEPGSLAALALKAHERRACVSGFYATRSFGRGWSSRIKDQGAKLKTAVDELHDAEYLAGGFLAIPRLVVEEVLEAGKESATSCDGQMKPVAGPLNDADFNAALRPCVYNDSSLFYDYFRPICVPSTAAYDRGDGKGGIIRPAGLPPEAKPYEYLSEDWAFSWRCRQANPDRPLLVWTFPWLLHHGRHGYSVLDGRAGVAPRAEGEGARVKR